MRLLGGKSRREKLSCIELDDAVQASGVIYLSASIKSDRPALIVLGLLVAVIVVACFSGLAARYYAAQPPTQCEQCALNSPSAERDHGHDSKLPSDVSTDDFRILGDTVAQWILVAVSFAGAVISAFAVLLVRDTLRVNRDALKIAGDANKNARDVGFAQIRSYVTLVDLVGQTDPLNKSFTVSVGIQNSGQTPAHEISIRVWLQRTQEDGRDILTHGSRSFEDHADLMPGEKRAIYAERIAFYNTINDPLQANSLEAYLEQRTGYFLRGFIRYKTVDGGWQKETAFNYRISGWHALQPADVQFIREPEGNRRT